MTLSKIELGFGDDLLLQRQVLDINNISIDILDIDTNISIFIKENPLVESFILELTNEYTIKNIDSAGYFVILIPKEILWEGESPLFVINKEYYCEVKYSQRNDILEEIITQTVEKFVIIT